MVLSQKEYSSLAVIFDEMVKTKCKTEHLIAVKCNALAAFQAKCITAETDTKYCTKMQIIDVQIIIKYLKRCEFMAMLS